MQRIGRVLHISSNGNIIIKVEQLPKIGEIVVNEDLRRIGKVFDVFGPVSSPYVSVKPTIRQPERLVNKVLYVLPLERRKEKIK